MMTTLLLLPIVYDGKGDHEVAEGYLALTS
jgi:hypothetical protein